jgi:hypothetical protein
MNSEHAHDTTIVVKKTVRHPAQPRPCDPVPPPAPERIRQELGWGLIPANRF